MIPSPPTQKLSAKHQVTLPKGARALVAAEADGYVCGTLHRMQRPETGEWFPVVVLLGEEEVRNREDAIRNNPDLDPALAERHVATLNGNMQRMSIDTQRRIVMPKHFVQYLQVEREVFMFSTNTTVLAWNPTDWLSYSGASDQAADDGPEAMPLLMI